MATIAINVDGKKAEATLTKLQKDFKSLDVSMRDAGERANNVTQRLSNIKSAVFGMKSLIASAVTFAASFITAKKVTESFIDTASQFEQYSNRMSAFTTSLSQQNSEMARARDFAIAYRQEISKATETLLLMKNYGLEDGNEQLKIYANTAIGSGKSIEQFAEAMADALTGENERLKEFGVKASLMGQNIAYSWTDSTGKVRNIVIKNNKDIIDSTLMAIFNEKYVGQLESYKNSWKGVMQGISNSWVKFKLDLADEGLFQYFKVLGETILESITGAYGGAKGSVRSFSNYVIDGIKTTIKGVGILRDTFSLFGGVFGFIKAAFWELVAYLGTGMSAIQKGWLKLSNTMSLAWAAVSNGTKKVFTTMINWIVDKINSISGVVNKAASAVGLDNVFGKLEHISFEKTTASIIKMGEPISNVGTAWKNATDARKSYIANFKGVAEGEGQKKSLDFLNKIQTKLKAAGKENENIKKQRETASKKLEELGAKYGGLSQAAKKAGKSAANAHKNTAKQAKNATAQIKNLTEAQKSANKDFENYKQLSGSFLDSILHGNFAESIKNLFSSIGSSMMKPLEDSLSKSLATFIAGLKSKIGGIFGGGAVSSFIGGGLLSIGGNILSGMLGNLLNSKLSKEQIKSAGGQTLSDLNSKALKSSIDQLGKYLQPQMVNSNKMLTHLQSMDNNFGAVANMMSKSQGFDFDGSKYHKSASSVLGGLFSSSEELIGAGLQFESQKISDFLVSPLVKGFKTVKESSSYLFGLINSESTKVSNSSVGAKIKKSLSMALEDGMKGIETATRELGINTNLVEKNLQNFVLDMGKINFKGLNAKEKAQALQAAFSGQLNTAVSSAVSSAVSPLKAGYIEAFQKTGEEYITTLIRVANEYEAAQTQLKVFGQAVDDFVQSNALIEAAGGLKKFQDAMTTFKSNFFTSEEQHGMQRLQLETALSNENFGMPASKEAFKKLVLNTQQKIIDLQTKAETKKNNKDLTNQLDRAKSLYGTLMSNMGEFASYYKAVEDAKSKSLANIGSFNTMFEIKEQVLKKQADSVGGHIATTIGGLKSVFNDLKGGVGGLTDAELAFLKANKEYIDATEKQLKTISSTTQQNFNSLIDSFSSSKESAHALADTLGVKVASTYAELANLAKKLTRDGDGLTDAESKLISKNKALIDSYTDVSKSVSILDSVASSIQNMIDKLSNAVSPAKAKLKDFIQAVANAHSLSLSKNYTAYKDAISKAVQYSSTLFESSNFRNSQEQKLAQEEALRKFKMLKIDTKTQIDYLKQIAENTKSQSESMVVKLKVLADNLGQSFSTKIQNLQRTSSGTTKFAEGGIVDRPTIGLIGEAGYPEAVIPMKNGRDVPVNLGGIGGFLKDLIEITTHQANEIKKMRKEIQELNDKTPQPAMVGA